MKTFKEFIGEARGIIYGNTRYHGTTKSRADSIKKGGFSAADGMLGTGVYSTPNKKEAQFHANRHSTEEDGPTVLKLRSFNQKKHKIHARNMYDRLPSNDKFKSDIRGRIKDRAQAHLSRGKDVEVINTTDKSGKATGIEVIQSPERATRDLVKTEKPIIRARKKR